VTDLIAVGLLRLRADVGHLDFLNRIIEFNVVLGRWTLRT